MSDARIETVLSMPFAENSYVLYRAGAPAALVVDPGFEPALILNVLRDRGLGVAAILNTHGHVDHIAGNAAMKEAFPDAPLVIGAGDAAALTDPLLNLSGLFGAALTSPPADRTVREGDVLELAGFTLHVLDLPGHSPGHVVFRLAEPGWLLGGDVLFAGGIGRTDFPNGSLRQLVGGIRAKLWPLPGETVVYPGHGDPTTVGEERETNPFCRG